MIVKYLSSRYTRKIAFLFLVIFASSVILPSRLNAAPGGAIIFTSLQNSNGKNFKVASINLSSKNKKLPGQTRAGVSPKLISQRSKITDIGGPGQPEMSSFKSIGTANMVNLFTGDFNYNIPLMDVGGYPINIFYDGGIGMDQEASWVGLGWNLNPGNINRNVRGIPDDFNGQDTLKQAQIMKPNKTWGLGVGADFELFGTKVIPTVGGELGASFNNYYGPSLNIGLRGNVAYKISQIGGTEKTAVSPKVNVGIDVNSRTGTSFSGGVALSANAFFTNSNLGVGIGVSTGYNSRSGIKALQISEQTSFNYHQANMNVGNSQSLYSTTISFVKPSYIPSLRMPLTNTAWSGRFQLGLGVFGAASDIEAELYGQKSLIAPEDTLQKKPMVGYLYYQNAINHPDYVMDFTRYNDREVTPNTPVISVPQYSYDVFSIQGEGTGGSIRAFRNDLGYVRDNQATSKDKNYSVGGDADPAGHYGGNFSSLKSPSSVGEWNSGNKLRNSIQFTNANATFESVYFRNPGEACVTDSNRLNQVGGVNLVRYLLSGTNQSPAVEAKLQAYNNVLKPEAGIIDLTKSPVIGQRNKRTQVISFLTADEASRVGLDTVIKNYDSKTIFDNNTDTLIYQAIPRVGSYRKPHHISQINVTESNGKRYVYGLPVYNTIQQDFTFSVDNAYASIPDKVSVNPVQLSTQSYLVDESSNRDGYVQVTSTPAYAHSFLLSGILSPDYVDITGNGITEDDLGGAIKFNYSQVKSGTDPVHRWRTPLTANDSANFNPGLRSEVKDDKGMISYGERESWYLGSVESKTMIAIFYTSKRINDGKGPGGINGFINASDTSLRQLDSIALFNKADLRTNGFNKARSIKTAHFKYSNALCQNTPDNVSTVSGSQGKLTLDSLWFTYNRTARTFKNKYSFNYASNPGYSFASSDRWGVYKPISMNPGGLKNCDYPYSNQNGAQKSVIDQNASAWALNKVIMPSGGEINISYESDDYAFVQNKRAAAMMQIAGFGNSSAYSAATDRLYPFTYPSSTENDYVFIQVPTACSNRGDVYNKYLQGTTQLAFRIWVLMPKGPEYLTCYANYSDYGVDSTNHNIIWVKITRLGNKSPLSMTALEYLRQQLPGQAFAGYDVSGEPPLKQVGDILIGMLASLRDAFTDPINAFRKDGKAMHTDLSKCFVRLNDPDGFKYGGGYRVKSIILKDNWNAMTGQFTASYGNNYDYTTTENFSNGIRKISSGVASYEPSIGGEENPFQSIIQVQDFLPAGPTSYGAVEMPAMDAFFPAPVVGYSKVTVTSVKTDTSSAKKSRSGIGKQVTEFYTARDYPLYYNYTPFDAESVKEFHQASTTTFLNKYAFDFKAQSQGFLVAVNDMHGKLKSQSSYAENDTATRISYTQNFYRNTGINGANDKFIFIGKDNAGASYRGNMGIDVDLMTDAREFAVKATGIEAQGQVDIISFLPFIPIPTIWPVSGMAQNIYRAVTTTKLVNYHAVLDSIVTIDKGSLVSSKNLAYDAETGEVLVTRTNNEFNQAVYGTSYPAYWAYGGMGLAYKNIDARFSGINFSDGKITNSGFDFYIFESGDEMLVTNAGQAGSGCDGQFASGTRKLIWAFDKNKNNTALITTPDFIFVDSIGRPFTMNNITFRIIRSGHRNQLDAKLETVTSMANPLASGKLKFDSTSKVINASATEFKEKWLADNDVFNRLKLIKDTLTCTYSEIPDSLGYLERKINPYRKGLVGNFRPYRNMVFYDSRKEYDTTSNTNIAANGYLKGFKPYWDFNASSNAVPDQSSTQWVWNSKLTKANAKGLELETVDALGVYTSAEYGFNKTLPLAIAQNARYSEMFAEGFEDYGYAEDINRTSFNFSNRQINFTLGTGGFLLNTDASPFRAHTGKYVLGINAGATALVNLPVLAQPDPTDAAVLNYVKDTAGVLSTLGGNYLFRSSVPSYVPSGNQGTGTFSTSSPGVSLAISPLDTIYPSNNNRMHYYTQSGSFYLNLTTAKTYTFTVSLGTSYNNSGATVNVHSNGVVVSIYDSLGTLVSTYSLSQNGFNYTSANYSAFLCRGNYLVNYSTTEIYNATNNGANYTSNTCAWSCTNSTSPDYKNLTKTTGCSFTVPISATTAMLNPLFSVPAGKKMLFSAWVRESCGDPLNGIACKDSTYNYNQVQMKFGVGAASDNTFYPVGPIIDGWQKYEGSFLVPANSPAMTINMINTGAAPVYFDDIRIQPFNANLKSYVYDPINLRLSAELDENNYARFYEYDEEGSLIRTKAETREGIKTISESRSALQKVIY